ncbi:MAG: nitrous oxide reductase accessory protein NosL [Longimicrobiales bacterium]
MPAHKLHGVMMAATVLVAACSPGPVPIVYGDDMCTHCRMAIVDERYGSELVTRTGLTHTFDSIECLADYVLRLDDVETIHSLWVTSFQHPGELIAVEDALFLHSEMLRSPMGANLTAFRSDAITERSLLDSFGGDVLTWEEVLRHVRANEHMHTGTDRPHGTTSFDVAPGVSHASADAHTDARAP